MAALTIGPLVTERLDETWTHYNPTRSSDEQLNLAEELGRGRVGDPRDGKKRTKKKWGNDIKDGEE